MELLSKEFYQQDTIDLSLALLGKLLVHQISPTERLVGRIIETEAYLGAEDPACHSFGFRKTPRTQSMFLPAGFSYVYFIYGMHFCFNVVSGDEQTPEAVLIRALQPIEGLEQMLRNRNTTNKKILCDGPGKLCQAMGIGSQHNALDLSHPPLQLFDDNYTVSEKEILTSERIGLGQAAGDACEWPLRFNIHPNVSI